MFGTSPVTAVRDINCPELQTNASISHPADGGSFSVFNTGLAGDLTTQHDIIYLIS